MIKKVFLNKSVLIVFGVILLFYIFLLKLPSFVNAVVVNFTSADVTLTNPRLSYRGMIGTTSLTNDTRFTLSANPVSPATDSNTNNLFVNDVVCFTDPNSNSCINQAAYIVNSVPTSDSFTLSSQVVGALTEGTNVIASQSAKWTVRFTPRTQVPSGGFLRLTIPNTANADSDGMPDALGFDSGDLPSNLLNGACGSNACLSFNGFTASAATLTTTSGVGHVILITLSSGLTQGAPYSFTLGSSSIDSLRMINPSPTSSSHTTGVADTYPVALLSEDASHNPLDKIIIKLLNADGVRVSATVGGAGVPIEEGGIPGVGGRYKFFLYGYSSPSAQVYLEGIGIKDQTATADKTGYFSFASSLSLLSPREVCLTAKDQLGRLSSPTCLPPFPINYDISIGPVLLPPTLSLNKPEYYTGEEIVISGQTIPNTDVVISLFVDPSKQSLVNYLATKLNPVKSVNAFTFPDLQTKADNKGNYSLKIPSAKSDLFRLFTRSIYEKQLTPQSTRLSLKILPIWWMFIVNLFIWLWLLTKPYLLWLIILILITAPLIYLLRRYLAPHRIASAKALTKLEKHPIIEV